MFGFWDDQELAEFVKRKEAPPPIPPSEYKRTIPINWREWCETDDTAITLAQVQAAGEKVRAAFDARVEEIILKALNRGRDAHATDQTMGGTRTPETTGGMPLL
jgi:hypothetical protein